MLILSMHVSCNQPEQSQPEQSPIQGTFHSAFVSRPSLPPTCLPWIGPLSPPAPVVTFLFSLSPDVPCRCAVVSPPRSAPPGVSHPVFHLPLFFISHLSGPLAHSTARKKKDVSGPLTCIHCISQERDILLHREKTWRGWGGGWSEQDINCIRRGSEKHGGEETGKPMRRTEEI